MSTTLKKWSTLVKEVKVLEYQLDALNAALHNCQKHASFIFDTRETKSKDTAEQLYCQSLDLCVDILTVKLGKTMEKLRESILQFKHNDRMLDVKLDLLMQDLTDIQSITNEAVHFFSTPENALNEQASAGFLALTGNFRVNSLIEELTDVISIL